MDETGKPVVGATITVAGTLTATTTSEDANYWLTVPPGFSVPVIKSVGFNEQEIAVRNKSVVGINQKDIRSR
jgi:hypothetical protein